MNISCGKYLEGKTEEVVGSSGGKGEGGGGV